MKTTIYLIRHAEAESNTNPHHIGEAYLTKEGIIQAQRIAKHFSSKDIDDIYVSKVLRAKLTAEEISKVVGKTPVELTFLKERNGTHSKDLLFVPEESFDEMKKRLIETKEFLENLSTSHVIVVSHAIFIKALLSYLMVDELQSEEIISNISDHLIIDNATISKIIFNKEKKKWRIASLNCFV